MRSPRQQRSNSLLHAAFRQTMGKGTDMSEVTGNEHDNLPTKRQQQTEQQVTELYPDPADVHGEQYAYSRLSLLEPHLSGHANAPARTAAMRHAQQTHGNRAVQRFLSTHHSRGSGTVRIQ